MEIGATVQFKKEEDLMANSVLIPAVQKEKIIFGAKLHQVIAMIFICYAGSKTF